MAPQANQHRSALLLLASLLGVAAPSASLAAQELDKGTIERLRRDQNEILRKAERLQKLMTRLKVRYEREGKQEQVAYLQEGLAHLERSGILKDVASIRENIAYASNSMDDSTVLRSAGVANARAFVEQMPDGFATMCGPRGARLSGGQKQRVAIARAVAKDPECLLLDEATSALDAESEQLVQESLERIMVGRTTVTIAHRLSTIRSADTICCVESGQVVESGTHDDLIAIEGAYYKLVSRQLSGSSVARSMNNLSTLAE